MAGAWPLGDPLPPPHNKKLFPMALINQWRLKNEECCFSSRLIHCHHFLCTNHLDFTTEVVENHKTCTRTELHCVELGIIKVKLNYKLFIGDSIIMSSLWWSIDQWNALATQKLVFVKKKLHFVLTAAMVIFHIFNSWKCIIADI